MRMRNNLFLTLAAIGCLASLSGAQSAFDQASTERTFQGDDLTKLINGVKYHIVAHTLPEMSDMGVPRNWAKEKGDKVCQILAPGSSAKNFTIKADASTKKLYSVAEDGLVDVHDACVMFGVDFMQQLPTSLDPAVQRLRSVMHPDELQSSWNCRPEVVDSASKEGLALDPANYADMLAFNATLRAQSQKS